MKSLIPFAVILNTDRQTDRQTNRQTDRITNHADRTTSALAKVIIGTISYGANIYLFGKKQNRVIAI